MRTRYDHLVTAGILSAAELELAQRAARRKQHDLESVLESEFVCRSRHRRSSGPVLRRAPTRRFPPAGFGRRIC